MEGLGQRLRTLRQARGLNQSAVAAAIEGTMAQISEYELDKTEPKFSTAIRLADFFGVTLDFLAGRERR